MSPSDRALPLGLAAALWLLAAGLFLLRPVLPVDETRYLAVAWEMWTSGHLLVPHLNGVPYSDKPPLQFWLINLSWSLFGVGAFAARLVPLASGIAAALLAGAIARLLWPYVAAWAVLALAATGLVTVFTSLLMFDGLLTAGVLLSVLGLVLVWKRERPGGWLLVALGVAIGILAKGPVAILHVAAVGLTAPWWSKRKGLRRWTGWYACLFGAILAGGAVALAWALPAARAGGPHYAEMILWGQSAGRVEKAFAHARPWFFYLLCLPLLLYPWGWWANFWRGARRTRWAGVAPEIRFCILWFVTALVVFSLISGKQPHYLLPELTAIALIAARRTVDMAATVRRRDLMLPFVPLAAFALAVPALALALDFGALARLPAIGRQWIAGSPVWPALALLAGLVVLYLATPPRPKAQAAGIAGAWAAAFLAIHLVAAPAVLVTYDWRRLTPIVRAHAVCGVAWVGDYAGELNFEARLTRPVRPIASDALDGWLARHPGGVAVGTWRGRPPGSRTPDREIAYRGRRAGLWLAPGDVAACRASE